MISLFNNEQSLLVTQTGGVMTWFSEEDPPLYAHAKISDCEMLPVTLPASCVNARMKILLQEDTRGLRSSVKSYSVKIQQNCL